MIEKTFLYKLFKADKVLFAGISLYVLGILYYAAHQREEFPFLLYGMYSLKETSQPTYTTYSVHLGGQEIKYAKSRDSQKEIISSVLIHAVPLIEQGKLNKADELKLKHWLLDYCSDVRLMGENKMDVYRLTCSYDEQGKVHVLKQELIYSYGTD